MRSKASGYFLEIGKYETRDGFPAIIAQIRFISKGHYVGVGAFFLGGIWYLHEWNIYGNSTTGIGNLDLKR